MRYREIVRELAARSVRYVVVGGIAVVLHGVPRATFDLDLLVDLAPENVLALVEALEALGYRPRAPVPARDLAIAERRAEWVRGKKMRAFTFWHSRGGEVDVLLDAPIDYAEAARDRLIVDADGTPVPLASIECLIRLKEAAGREVDRSDVEALRKAQRASEKGPE